VNRVVPGHYNLNLVSDYVKQGIFQAEEPREFGTIAACDGIAQGHDGMHYILPTRDLIASDVEMMIGAHRLDGVVLLGSCDKIVPGMLMAAARMDVPAVLVAGGPWKGAASSTAGRRTSPPSPKRWHAENGEDDRAEYRHLENCAGPGCGSCSFFGTAIPCAVWRRPWDEPSGERDHPDDPGRPSARRPGVREADHADDHGGGHGRKIINQKSIENTIRLNAAVGGSTNAILHLLAIAMKQTWNSTWTGLRS